MEGITNHFELLDYSKNLLFNAVTKEQEKTARKMIDCLLKQEIFLEIGGE